MGTKLIVALIAVCLTVIVCSSVIIASFFYDDFMPLFEKYVFERSHQTGTAGTNKTAATPSVGVFVPILQPANTINSNSSKPNIITVGLKATDERIKFSHSLHVSGRLNNTGGGTSYSAYLHVVAYNSEGLPIDNNYKFGGMTGHITLGLDFKLNYTGSPIDNCTITPVLL